jgi:DNA-binding XRE family transcriptional regulator
MRLIEQITIGKMSYTVPTTIVREIEELLRKAKVNVLRDDAHHDTVAAHVQFPQIDDPLQGPALALRVLRTRHKLTQQQLAAHVEVKQSHISEMERGKRPIGKAMAKRLAEALQADWKSLL